MYIHHERIIFNSSLNDEFHIRVAKNVEARKLVVAGFEYVTGVYNDCGKIFRKRK